MSFLVFVAAVDQLMVLVWVSETLYGVETQKNTGDRPKSTDRKFCHVKYVW